MSRWIKAGVAALGTLTGGGLTAYNSATSVKEGQTGIVTTYGRVERTAEPGLAFHWPWQSVTRMTNQAQSIDIPMEVYSKDSQLAPSNVVTVTFTLPKENTLEVHSKYGASYFESVIRRPVENIFRECFGQMTADQIIANRVQLNAQVSERLKVEFESRQLHFERLSISIKFNDAFNKSAEESAIARTRVNTEKQNLERLEVEGQQKVVSAKAEGDAALERRTKEAKGIELVGISEAKVIEMKGAALKSNPDYPRLQAIEKWDGHLPTTMLPGQTMPFIDLTPPPPAKK